MCFRSGLHETPLRCVVRSQGSGITGSSGSRSQRPTTWSSAHDRGPTSAPSRCCARCRGVAQRFNSQRGGVRGAPRSTRARGTERRDAERREQSSGIGIRTRTPNPSAQHWAPQAEVLGTSDRRHTQDSPNAPVCAATQQLPARHRQQRARAVGDALGGGQPVGGAHRGGCCSCACTLAATTNPCGKGDRVMTTGVS